MDEDEGAHFDFDEVDMQDIIDFWAKTYAEGIRVQTWYYDCRTSTVLIRLIWDEEEEYADEI